MSLTYGFYNSIKQNGVGDRLYTAEQFAQIFDGVINDGIFNNIGNNFVVRWVEGLTVVVGSGRAWFERTWTYNDSDYRLTLDSGELLLPRYDAVVLETNHAISSRTNSLKIIKGTPANDAKYPTLIQNEDQYQHPLAYIYVPASASAIDQNSITSVVGTSACPFVTSILQQTDVQHLYNNWTQSWNTWFNNTTTTEQAQIDAWQAQKYSEFNTWFDGIKEMLGSSGQQLVDNVTALVNKVTHIATATVYTLTAAGWATPSEQEYPFEQTINVVGMTASEEPIFEWADPDTVNHDSVRLYDKNKAYVNRWITQNGSIKFQCWSKKPTIDLKIRVRRFA